MNEEIKNCYIENKKIINYGFLILVVIFGLWMLTKVVKEVKVLNYVGKAPTEVKTIAVNGKGEVMVKPDIAVVDFSFTTENIDISKATEAVNVKMDSIIAELKALGIEEKDIKTTGYNINPRYEYPKTYSSYYPYPEGQRNLVGYEVTQSLQVKIRDLSKAGTVVAKLGTLKITNLGGLSFMIDKEDEFKKDARNEAIKEAKMEADKLASSLGVKLGSIVGFSENGNYPIYPTYAKSLESQAYGMGGAASDAVVPAGETKITSNVSIVYEIL